MLFLFHYFLSFLSPFHAFPSSSWYVWYYNMRHDDILALFPFADRDIREGTLFVITDIFLPSFSLWRHWFSRFSRLLILMMILFLHAILIMLIDITLTELLPPWYAFSSSLPWYWYHYYLIWGEDVDITPTEETWWYIRDYLLSRYCDIFTASIFFSLEFLSFSFHTSRAFFSLRFSNGPSFLLHLFLLSSSLSFSLYAFHYLHYWVFFRDILSSLSAFHNGGGGIFSFHFHITRSTLHNDILLFPHDIICFILFSCRHAILLYKNIYMLCIEILLFIYIDEDAMRAYYFPSFSYIIFRQHCSFFSHITYHTIFRETYTCHWHRHMTFSPLFFELAFLSSLSFLLRFQALH